MKSEDMKDEWEEADAKQQQQVESNKMKANYYLLRNIIPIIFQTTKAYLR